MIRSSQTSSTIPRISTLKEHSLGEGAPRGRATGGKFKIKYLGVLLRSDGTLEHEMDRRVGAALAVLWVLYRTVVVKRELIQNQSIFVVVMNLGK